MLPRPLKCNVFRSLSTSQFFSRHLDRHFFFLQQHWHWHMIVHPILDFLADVLSVPRRCRSIHLKTYCGLQANECKIVRRYGFSRRLVDFYHVAHKWILSLEVLSFLLRPFAATLFFPNPCCRHISLYYKSDSHIAIYKSPGYIWYSQFMTIWL